jgi:anaerobic magnesium-protoporphyrin IX monomethyl ester cyclase
MNILIDLLIKKDNMKKILFINPCLRQNARRKFPPVGLAYILTAVEKAGIEFDLFDMDAHELSIEDLREHLQRKTYDIVALGTIVTALKLVRDIAATIREINPVTTIIAGNSVATSIPEMLLRNTEIDIAVLGEGDITIVELLRALDTNTDLNQVKGIAFLRDGKFVKTAARELIPNLDEIGFPNWDLFDLPRYNKNMLKPIMDDSTESVVYPLNAARGCPFSCTFCYHVFKGQRYRKYSEEAVMKEFTRLHDKYQATFIFFWDELTFPTIPTVERMVTQLEQLPFRVGWDAITRGDLFGQADVALVRRMRDVGCKSISFSIENASPEILQAMNKKIQIHRVVKHCEALIRGGVTPHTSIIFGYPQETPETIQMTLDLCERCNIYPSVGFLQPLPGTPIYEWAVQNGYIKNEMEYLLEAGDRQDLHVNLTQMSSEELLDRVVHGMQRLAERMGLKFDNPLKTGVYQKPQKTTQTRGASGELG